MHLTCVIQHNLNSNKKGEVLFTIFGTSFYLYKILTCTQHKYLDKQFWVTNDRLGDLYKYGARYSSYILDKFSFKGYWHQIALLFIWIVYIYLWSIHTSIIGFRWDLWFWKGFIVTVLYKLLINYWSFCLISNVILVKFWTKLSVNGKYTQSDICILVTML